MRLIALSGTFAVCRLGASDDVPAWAGGGFVSVTRTAEELSVVCGEERVPDGVVAERGWRGLRVAGTLAFDVVGVLAALTRPLADVGVPVFVISTFDTDYLFLKSADFTRAEAALRAAGHVIAE